MVTLTLLSATRAAAAKWIASASSEAANVGVAKSFASPSMMNEACTEVVRSGGSGDGQPNELIATVSCAGCEK